MSMFNHIGFFKKPCCSTDVFIQLRSGFSVELYVCYTSVELQAFGSISSPTGEVGLAISWRPMPSYKSTAEFAAAQLRTLDWILRHQILARLSVSRPALHKRVLKLMTPDECLDGQDFTSPLSEHSLIIMTDRKPESKLVQTRITKYFKHRRRR